MLFSRLRTLAVALTVSALFGAGLSSAWAQQSAGAVQVDKPWTRATPPSAPTGAGYLSLTNKGPQADRLMDVRSPIAGRTEIHTMEVVSDVSRMRWQKDGIELPPGQTIELKPGGTHVMFLELKQPIRAGDRVSATLVFQRAGEVQVEMVAAPLGATAAPGAAAAAAAAASHHGKH